MAQLLNESTTSKFSSESSGQIQKFESFKQKPFIRSVLSAPSSATIVKPRHNANQVNGLVMTRPSLDSMKENKVLGQIVDVVVDPYISQKLRPHQREGVSFLYDCVMGLKEFEGNGAILADEMGLGKTVQTIALIWTLLKQTPWTQKQPMKRVLVVCPASIVTNWKKEFNKWLGETRVKIYAVDSSATSIRDFIAGRIYQVMVIGFEKMRCFHDVLQEAKFDLVVVDEGHRLKNSNIMASKILHELTLKRIILSGTPIQNDLGEFFAMVEFVNPGILGSKQHFRHTFEVPIARSLEASCSVADRTYGLQQFDNLIQITKEFILRRTADVNKQYLPPKTNVVLFCRMEKQQQRLYKDIIENIRPTGDSYCSSDLQVLPMIHCLRKCANNPSMLVQDLEKMNIGVSLSHAMIKQLQSGKTRVLKSLLHQISLISGAKVVLVSNWTSALDLFAALCKELSYSYVRLDGSTPQQKRQSIIDRFNETSTFVFLLSSKAGGVGLNLTGASRLILYDIDWNPANDLQAMARIWRDGQKSNVVIYRLLATGTIEERVFQRQLTKMSLSDSVIDDVDMQSNQFTAQDLQDIFSLNSETACLTHECIECPCEGDGSVIKPVNESGGDDWRHHKGEWSQQCLELDPDVIGACLDSVSFVFSLVQ